MSKQISARKWKRRGLFAALGVGVSAAALGVATPVFAAATWSNPAMGKITSGYKSPSRPDHLGTDVANKQGTPIWAASAGTVVGVRTNSYPGDTRPGLIPGRTGNAVMIEHAGGYRTYYGHIHTAYVRKGQKVGVGQQIAGMGTTGNSTGNHLHFEVHKDKVTTNPYKFMSGLGISLGASAPAGDNWVSLKNGSSGEPAKVAQHLLTAHGYSLAADGNFGSVSIAAAKKFQKANGLVADGVVGAVSWPYLVKNAKSGTSGSVAKAAQTALNIHKAGLKVDGNFGATSVAAAKKFQKAKGLVVDGLVGVITWEAML